MKYALGLLLLTLSSVAAAEHSTQLFFRARVPASYSVEMNSKSGADPIIHSNTSTSSSQAKTKIQKEKNQYRVTIIQP
jgi:hypothetical protein